MSSLANEDDRIDAGQSKWNDVGYIQTAKDGDADEEEDPEDDSNVGISSLNKQKHKLIITDHAEKMRDEIN